MWCRNGRTDDGNDIDSAKLVASRSIFNEKTMEKHRTETPDADAALGLREKRPGRITGERGSPRVCQWSLIAKMNSNKNSISI